MKKIINLIVDEKNEGHRIDIFINKKESLLSRTRIKNLILNKKLKINNQTIITPSKKIKLHDKILLEITTNKEPSLKPFDYKLDIMEWGDVR